jgi:hypothetical protein
MLYRFATTPEPPYFVAVITTQFDGDRSVLQRADNETMRLAALNPGFLGIEAAREETGFGITVSYWSTRDAFDVWYDAAFDMMKTEFDVADPTAFFQRLVLHLGWVEIGQVMGDKHNPATP